MNDSKPRKLIDNDVSHDTVGIHRLVVVDIDVSERSMLVRSSVTETLPAESHGSKKSNLYFIRDL